MCSDEQEQILLCFLCPPFESFNQPLAVGLPFKPGEVGDAMEVADEVETLQEPIEIFHVPVKVVPVQRKLHFVQVHGLDVDEPFVERVIVHMGVFFQVPKEQLNPTFMIVRKESLIQVLYCVAFIRLILMGQTSFGFLSFQTFLQMI